MSDSPIADIVHKPTIMVDPATQMALDIKMREQEKKKIEAREQSDLHKFKNWCKDDRRVKEFANSKQTIINEDLDLFELFLTYDKEEGVIKDDKSLIDLSLSQQASLSLFPYVKSLITGKIYTITDALTLKKYNEEYDEWVEKAAGSPQFKAAVPCPPQFYFQVDMIWDAERYFINKLKRDRSVEAFYTFLVPKSSVQCEYHL